MGLVTLVLALAGVAPARPPPPCGESVGSGGVSACAPRFAPPPPSPPRKGEGRGEASAAPGEGAALPLATAAVSAALTETTVQVKSDFSGARIVLYGAVFDPSGHPGDVVVIVRGPDQPVRITRKQRVAGLWLNSRPVVFQGAPGFYRAASNRPLDDIANFGELRRLGAGLDHLSINAPAEQRTETRYGVRDVVVSRLGSDYYDWRSAVVRLKEQAHLYDEDDHGVRFVDRGLFRAEIALPAAAPTGVYRADILLFQHGRLVSARARTLTVEKVGLERALYVWAHVRPWSYGLASMAFALAVGWAASAAFRRD